MLILAFEANLVYMAVGTFFPILAKFLGTNSVHPFYYVLFSANAQNILNNFNLIRQVDLESDS